MRKSKYPCQKEQGEKKMNSKEEKNVTKNRSNGETIDDKHAQENNENRSSSSPSASSASHTEPAPCQSVKIQNSRLPNNDQFKLNNNIGDDNGGASNSSSKHSRSFISSTNESTSQGNNSCGAPALLDLKNTNAAGSYIFTYSKTTPSNYLNTLSPQSSSGGENGSKVSNDTDKDMRNNVDYQSAFEKCPAKVSCDSSFDSNNTTWNSSATTFPLAANRGINNIGNSIGSTSQGTCCFLRPNINGSRSEAVVPGPSGIQRSREELRGERQDSSSGNEGDMSDGEDCCFYTYKGIDDPARHEFRQDLGRSDHQRDDCEAEPHQSGSSSPEMDFLEMDFDPGPSCEQDTGDSDMASINEDIQNLALDSAEPDPPIPLPLNDLSGGRIPSRIENSTTIQTEVFQQTCHNKSESTFSPISNQPSSSHWMPSSSSGIHKWEATGLHRSTLCPLQESYGHHNTNGDLISPGDSSDSDSELWIQDSTTGGVSMPENANLDSRKVNLSSTLYHRMMAKKLMLNKQTAFNQSGDSNIESELCAERAQNLLPIEKIMLWSEQEATVKQVTQIATSACGAAAAINALLALDVAFSRDVLVRGVATRSREPGTPLPRYLISRSNAGATHKDLARGMSLATSGAVVTKFFAFYPERKISFSHWLHYWISRGAVPIATLNLQHCGEGNNIPDAWHHQMIFGVGPAGIYVTNPLQCLPEQVVWHQLISPSILLIRRQDVLSHWSTNTDLRPLAQMDHRWRKLNVLGQIVNLVRETMGQRRQSSGTTSSVTHIRIPASYKAGITLVMRSDASGAAELLRTEQLPIL